MTDAPVFFETPTTFAAWLRTHHARETELLVGFYKKASGRPSLTWPESVAEALCVGWITAYDERATKSATRFASRRGSPGAPGAP